MDLKKPLSEAAQKSIEETLRKEHPYLEPTALADITEQCRQTILGEQIREFVARRLREEHQWLKQDVLEQLAQKCKETLSIRLTAEAPRMQASKAGVNLLTLPAEIRHRIFLLVLIVDRQYSVEGPGGTRLIELADFEMLSDSNCSDWVYYAGNEQWIEQPSLTRVCRQIREETPPVYYSANGFMVNVFHFEHLDYLIDHQDGKHVKLYSYGIQAWLKAIGATNRASIKTLILMNDQTTAMRVSAKRFATALREGGVGLNEGVIKSFEKDYDLRKRTTIWKEVTAEDDNISSEASVEWTLTW